MPSLNCRRAPFFLLSTVFVVNVLPTFCWADDLDDVVDYLVQEQAQERRQDRRQEKTHVASLNPTDTSRSEGAETPKQFFMNTGNYRIDTVATRSEQGVVESSTTYYASKVGEKDASSFTVRLVQSELGGKGFARTFVNEIQSLGLTFVQARKLHALEVSGLPTAYLEVQGNAVKASITRIRKDIYLVVRSNEWLPVNAFEAFLNGLPFDRIDTVLLSQPTPASGV